MVNTTNNKKDNDDFAGAFFLVYQSVKLFVMKYQVHLKKQQRQSSDNGDNNGNNNNYTQCRENGNVNNNKIK